MGNGKTELQSKIRELEDATKALGSVVNSCGVSWNDNNFKRLAANISQLAQSSRTVFAAVQPLIAASENCKFQEP